MLLAIDIGNTNIKIGVFGNSADNMLFCFAVSATSKRTPDEYSLLIKNILRENSVDSPSACVISSVVPSLTADLSQACKQVCGCEPFIICSGTRTGFPIKIDIASQLGADIVSNTAAAFTVVKAPFIVVDIGTATTLAAVDSDGKLIGTVIAPGVDVSLEALNETCALLTDVSLERPDSVIGKNSQESIRSGAFWGHVYMIDGFIDHLKDELCSDSEDLCLVGTGGCSEKILPFCRAKFDIIPDLTLKGAAALYYHNTANRRRNYTKS